jgi:DNA-binding FadR family transcriptional regulator
VSASVQRKSDRVEQAILHEIREGRWEAGQRLPSERELAARLAVSRGAVREALASLKLAGRIDTRLGQGSFVADEGDASATAGGAAFLATLSIADALEIREDLEVAAVALAIRRARPADLIRIREAADRLAEPLEAGDYGAYLARTLDLHVEIARAGHSEVLINLIAELIETHRAEQWVLERSYTPEIGAYSMRLHQALAEAVIDRDYAAAVEATCRHYEDYPVALQPSKRS